MKLKDWHEILDDELRDPEYAMLYLENAFDHGSPEECILALKNIIRANQKITSFNLSQFLFHELVVLSIVIISLISSIANFTFEYFLIVRSAFL